MNLGNELTWEVSAPSEGCHERRTLQQKICYIAVVEVTRRVRIYPFSMSSILHTWDKAVYTTYTRYLITVHLRPSSKIDT